VAQRITQFIDAINVGVLGALGLIFLIYTTISLMQKIEESLNFIWHVRHTRHLGERFSRYLSVLMVGPILVFSALGITASVLNLELVRQVMAIDTLGAAIQVIGRLTPYLLVISAFTFIYLFIPNTQVSLVPALIGGIVGGIAWQTAGWLFALFVATSGSYAAIYSSFAVLVLFMIWLYVSWLVLLFGASVAFYVQHPEYLYGSLGEPRLSIRLRERLALSIMSLLAGRFVAGAPALSLAELTHRLGVPTHVLERVLDELQAGELVAASADDPARYFPARDLLQISVLEVFDAVRNIGEAGFVAADALPAPTPVEQVLERLQAARESTIGAFTLRDLADLDQTGIDQREA
jgi:membrane protein